MNRAMQTIMENDANALCGRGLQAYMEQDYQTAIPYYKASVQLGSSAAMCNLGYCYYYGRGVRRSKEKARYYWETSAVMGRRPPPISWGICIATTISKKTKMLPGSFIAVPGSLAKTKKIF